MNTKVVVNTIQRLGSRNDQQDRIAILEIPGASYSLAAVFDGVGGSIHGAHAAELGRIAVEDEFCEQLFAPFPLPPWHIAWNCIVKAHNRVLSYGKMLTVEPDEILPGSTALVAIFTKDDEVGLSWSGDSVAARWDGTDLKVLTRPHNARSDPLYQQHNPGARGSGLTRYLGESVNRYEPQIGRYTIEQNTSLILMSDGAFEILSTEETVARLRKQSAVEILNSIDEKMLGDNASLIEVAWMPCQEG